MKDEMTERGQSFCQFLDKHYVTKQRTEK